jgi:lysophospholipid hydrolase
LERTAIERSEQGAPTNLTTVAVLGVGPSVPLGVFSKRLAAELMHIESTLHVDKSVVSQFNAARGAFSGDVSLIRWLAEMEEKYHIVLYQCDSTFTPWTRRCIRQADCILVVAWSHSDPILR